MRLLQFFCSSFSSVVFFCALLGLPTLSRVIVAQSLPSSSNSRPEETQILELGQSVTGELQGDRVRNYVIRLEVGQYLSLTVAQQSIDVIVRLIDSREEKILEVDRTGAAELESVIFIADRKDNYTIQIQPFNTNSTQGSYRIEVTELRTATARDRDRIRGENLLARALQIQSQGTEESIKQAISLLEESLMLWQNTQTRDREALTQFYLGALHYEIREYDTALEYYQRALSLSRKLSDRATIAATLNRIGLTYRRQRYFEKAIEYYQQSLAEFRELGDRSMEGTLLNNIGLAYRYWGKLELALEHYEQALLLRREISDREGELATIGSLAGVYSALGDQERALDYYNQELQGLPREEQSTNLSNVGLIYRQLGELQTALDYYQRSLEIDREIGDRSGEGITLNNMGAVYFSLGEIQKALDTYDRSLEIYREIDDSRREAITLSNIGLVYRQLGEYQIALDYYNRALPLHQNTRNLSGKATTLNNIGATYNALKDWQQALDYYQRALLLYREVNNSYKEATALNNSGTAYESLGDGQKALNSYEKALSLYRELQDPSGEAIALHNLANLTAKTDDRDRARDYFQQALTLFRQVGNRSEEAFLLYSFARLQREDGDLKDARDRIEAAIEIVEDLRTKIASSDLQTSYFATVQDYYEFYIDLLMQLHRQDSTRGYDALALHASERSRARSLLELLAEANADLRQGVDPQLLNRERTLQHKLEAVEDRRIRLVQGSYSNAQLTKIDRERQNLLNELDEVRADIRTKSPRHAALTQPQPLTLTEIQKQVLDRDTLLLFYSLGEERSYLWAVTPTQINSYELPPRKTIERAVKLFRRGVKNARRPVTRFLPDALELTKIILQPVASQLENKRLLIVGDGALQYIPFGALPHPETLQQETPEYLPAIARHEIVYLPSASALDIIRSEGSRKAPSKELAIFADPVFDAGDERLSNTRSPSSASSTLALLQLDRAARDAGLSWTRLPGTRQEAEAILSLLPENSDRFFDFQANKTAVTRSDLGDYRILHFATHGFLNSETPELSGVVMSLVDPQGNLQNGFLRLHDVYNLDLPGTELVVLSACDTGTGELVRGEGSIGLTRGFMHAGASRTIASLWKVSDRATAALMSEFYENLLVGKMRSAQALRSAQLELWQGEWAHPYYWAAFTQQGEWQ